MCDLSSVNLGAIDLNLLVVLESVLEAGSATRAAQKLHVTQSAVSNSLRRLRALFDDPLLVRTSHGLVPTARAQALRPALRAWLDAAGAFFDDQAPEQTARLFRIACSDAVGATLLPGLLTRLTRKLLRARVQLVSLERVVRDHGLESGAVDLLVGAPAKLPSGCTSEPLYSERYACIVRAQHPHARTMTLATYTSLGHVELALFGEPDDRVDRALARVGRSRTISLSVPSFSLIPLAVMSSDLVATVSSRAARAFAPTRTLRILRPPLPLPEIQVRQIWHRRSNSDVALASLRAAVREMV